MSNSFDFSLSVDHECTLQWCETSTAAAYSLRVRQASESQAKCAEFIVGLRDSTVRIRLYSVCCTGCACSPRVDDVHLMNKTLRKLCTATQHCQPCWLVIHALSKPFPRRQLTPLIRVSLEPVCWFARPTSFRTITVCTWKQCGFDDDNLRSSTMYN